MARSSSNINIIYQLVVMPTVEMRDTGRERRTNIKREPQFDGTAVISQRKRAT